MQVTGGSLVQPPSLKEKQDSPGWGGLAEDIENGAVDSPSSLLPDDNSQSKPLGILETCAEWPRVRRQQTDNATAGLEMLNRSAAHNHSGWGDGWVWLRFRKGNSKNRGLEVVAVWMTMRAQSQWAGEEGVQGH
jgi:hypothetical protein